VLYGSGPRIIRINENYVNPVHPVREVPPMGAKFIVGKEKTTKRSDKASG